jgi:hypothetical protein
LSLPSFLSRKGTGATPVSPPTSFPNSSSKSPIFPVAPVMPKS